MENTSFSIKHDLMPFWPAFHKSVPVLHYPLKTQLLKSKNAWSLTFIWGFLFATEETETKYFSKLPSTLEIENVKGDIFQLAQ